MKDITHSGIRFTLIATALAAALAASAGAEAQVGNIIGTAGNDVGEMLMTSATCGLDGSAAATWGRLVLSLTREGHVLLRGCATRLPPDRLYISWGGGSAVVVPTRYFTAVTTPAPHAEPAVFTVEELEADMRRRGLPTVEELEGKVRRLSDRILVEQAAARRTPMNDPNTTADGLLDDLEDEYRAGQVPKYGQVQVQHQLMASGAELADFAVYAWDAHRLAIIEVRHDPAMQARIRAAWEAFWPDYVAGRAPGGDYVGLLKASLQPA